MEGQQGFDRARLLGVHREIDEVDILPPARGGLQLLAIGVAGEYIGKTYMEVKRRPTYQIEKTIQRESSAGRVQKKDGS